ncbi:hypothetical protein SAMN05216357_113111 [Porphyromonadaceae bacterium KH3CP3RA]|nr:hypothetical protein SAMN05216357_113111 [Porphyromonadaceae bacterium KH3CP3RA]
MISYCLVYNLFSLFAGALKTYSPITEYKDMLYFSKQNNEKP